MMILEVFKVLMVSKYPAVVRKAIEKTNPEKKKTMRHGKTNR